MADFITDPDVEDICRKLIATWNDILGHIDPDKLLFVREISASQRNQVGALVHIYPPYNLLNPDVKYIVAVYFKGTWDDKNEAQRAALLMHQLLHIPEDFEGAPLQHPVQDFTVLVDNFGSDYLDNPHIPNLIERETNIVPEADLDVDIPV